MWWKKHAPESLDEMALKPEVRDKLEHAQAATETPNLFLHGPPGSGKTTAVQIITSNTIGRVKDLDGANLGLKNTREEVKNFSRAASYGRSLVVINEADAASKKAKNFLRTIMDRYAESTSYFLTTNHPDDVNEAVQDRCMSIEMKMPPPDECLRRLQTILRKEGISVPEARLQMFIEEQDVNSMRSLLDAAELEFSRDPSSSYSQIESEKIRETVAAVAGLAREYPDGVPLNRISDRLGLSSAHHRVHQAAEEGYLVDRSDPGSRASAWIVPEGVNT